MHPLLLYATIRHDHAEHHRRLRLERTIRSAADHDSTAPPAGGVPAGRPTALVRAWLERLTARLGGRQIGRA